MTLNGKRPAESAVEQNVYKIFPNDLNSKHTVFGGLVMGLCDRTALIVAERHSGHSCVTAAVDSLTFLAPAHSGETLVVKATVNRTWRSSMEIGVHVAAENSFRGDRRHVVSAYLTFVALGDDGSPTEVPPLLPETEIERRRFDAAKERRTARLEMRDSQRN
ncbi:MAG: acyl-CoA thioesterase [Woeseiaceae bacterium]|nr:acyl-CoA thioesterase [Woeseiaceae bacterium]